MSAFLVVGAGGHGRVIADVVRAAGHEVVGFVDADPARLHTPVEATGACVVMLQQCLIQLIRDKGNLPEGVDGLALGVGDNRRRLQCLQAFGRSACPPLIHSTAVVSPSASLGAGTVVLPGAVVNAGARVGAAVIVNTGAIVEHDCVIDDGVHLSPHATLAGAVHVGERSWVGAGATVIQCRNVGADATVGAGAVVIRDVCSGMTVGGVPARLLH